MTMDQTARDPVLVDPVLQGGGPHGAFTWGVLDLGRNAHAPDYDRHARGFRCVVEAQRRMGFVSLLKEEGRKSANAFLTLRREDIGKRSTADLDVLLAEC
jgi:hypothetical protein